MALTTYTLDQLTAQYRSIIRGLITPAPDTSPPSDWYLTARMAAVLHHAAQSMTLYLLQQLRPSKASIDWVAFWAETLGLDLQPAAKASGFVMLTGTAGSSQGSGSACSAPDGAKYVTTAGVRLPAPAWTGSWFRARRSSGCCGSATRTAFCPPRRTSSRPSRPSPGARTALHC